MARRLPRKPQSDGEAMVVALAKYIVQTGGKHVLSVSGNQASESGIETITVTMLAESDLQTAINHALLRYLNKTRRAS